MMEHRWSKRQEVHGEVALATAGERPRVVRLCDLSLGGLRVEGLETGLPVDGFVTLSFSIGPSESVSHHRVLAQVVHCHAHQAGMLFIEPALETVQGLRNLLSHSPGHPPRFTASAVAQPLAPQPEALRITAWRQGP